LALTEFSSGVDILVKIIVDIVSAFVSAFVSHDRHNDARSSTLLAEPGCSPSFG
jgi:hypothetical protein